MIWGGSAFVCGDMSTRPVAAATEMQFVPESDVYRAGVCNIGPAEIQRRRRAGHAGVVATLALLGILVLVGAPPISRLALVVPAMIAASGYLQARLRFCANYGWRGIFNVGSIGDDEAVVDPSARAADQRRAVQIGLGSLGIGAIVAAMAVLLPV